MGTDYCLSATQVENKGHQGPYTNLLHHWSKQPLPVENPGEAPAGGDKVPALTVALGKPHIPSGPAIHLQNKGIWTRWDATKGALRSPRPENIIPSEVTIVLVIMFLQHRVLWAISEKWFCC